MPFKPESFDYEGVFPARSNRRRNSDAEVEEWPSSARSKSFDYEPLAPAGAPLPAAETFAGGGSIADEHARAQSLAKSSQNSVIQRTHALSFICLFIFSVVLYVRPYEAIPALSSLTSMAFYTGLLTLVVFAGTQIATEGNLTARPKEINLVLLFGLAAILSMPMAVDPAYAWKTFSEMLLKTIVIFVVFVNVVRTEWRLRLLLLLVLGVSLYLSINAINDYRLGVFHVGSMETKRIAGRIKGLFENSNDLALHLVTMIPIALGLGLAARDHFRKLIYFAVIGVMVGAVVVTFSRGGFIGLVAVVLVLVRRLGRKNRVATTTGLVFAVILFLALAPGAYSSRLSTVFNSGADLTGSASQRTEVLKRSFWVALRYPLFGVGIGNFHFKSPRELETHNAYTQVASEMGLAALLIYVLFLIHPLRRLRLIENESYAKPEQRRFYYLAVGLQAAMIGFMVSSFFGAVAYQWYVYYLVGYAVCLHRLYIMKFQSETGFPQAFWEHPFPRKSKKL